jgi:hypothetical protein
MTKYEGMLKKVGIYSITTLNYHDYETETAKLWR